MMKASGITFEKNDFVLDGRPIRIISGAMHYFRVVPEYWRDRMLKLKACGFNTLETYVAWNLHEPKPGEFQFDGGLDVVRYIETAAELGLMVIVRPGPYICSELDLGGLPPWLLADPGMRLRCCYAPYLEAVDRFFDNLLPRLTPLQMSHGGPIIAMQVENEYGSYGTDHEYLRHLEQGMRTRGVDTILFTSDGATDWMLQGGTLPDVLKTANFGTDVAQSLAKLREYQPEGPLMVGEYWVGGFDLWGGEHFRRDPGEIAAVFDEILRSGASLNAYMFCGGTNFGFMNGAVPSGSQYKAIVTSYDCHGLLNEFGEPTPAYFKCRDVIGNYAPLPDIPLPRPVESKAFGKVQITESVDLFCALDRISEPVERPVPEPMEYLGQNYGFILYRTTVRGTGEACPLVVQEVRDRALVFLDGEYQGLVDREDPQLPIVLSLRPGEHRLDILVENMGRINYGPYMCDRKGIAEGVRLDRPFLNQMVSAILHQWEIFPLPLDNLASLEFTSEALCLPAFYRGTFTIDQPADTHLALDGWTKGVCFINGFNLGRYWDRGPQRTLYVPGPLLHPGDNELIVFELHGVRCPVVELVEKERLG
jgi:beta-galactosidase